MNRTIHCVLLAGLASLVFLGDSCSSGSSTRDPRTFTPVGGAAPPPETISSFSVASPPTRGIVNRFDHKITLYMPGASVGNIAPDVTLADGVSIVSPVAATIDLTSTVTYTLSDGSHYEVSAVTTAAPSAATVNAWLGTGINLGNDLDAWPGPEGSWTDGVVAQKYMFDDFRTLGFEHVRIPITWGAATNPSDRLSDDGASSVVNGDFMQRVDAVAGWGIDAGLTVVINAHHEDWIRTKTGAAYADQKPRFIALWTQIAEHFKSWPPQLVFEILNEPWGDITNAEVNDLNATILAVIRSTNPTRTVILGPNGWNSMDALRDGVFSVPAPAQDPHIIATMHNYNPYSFCGHATGGWGSASDVATMTSDLDAAASWASARGVPLYMGEYGATVVYDGTVTDPDSRREWYRQVSDLARARGMSMAIWDHHLAFDLDNLYGDLKVYDRVARAYDKAIVDVVLGK